MADGPRGAPPVGWRALLSHRRFVHYLLSLSAGEIGYSVYAVAAPWLAYQTTHSLLDVGAVLAAEFGLYALSFVAAPFVDRAPEKRTILLVGYLLQGVAAGLLGVLSLRGLLDFPLLLGLVGVISFVWDFTWSTLNAIPPLLLPKESLFRASGLSGLFSGGNQVAGFTVGGALILLTGAGGAMLLYAVLNVAAALLAIGVSTAGAPSARGTVWEGLAEGWRTMVHPSGGRPLLALTFYVTLQGFLAPGAVLLITDIASRASGQTTYGLLFTAFVLGGAGMGILLGQVSPRRHVGYWLMATPPVAALFLLGVPYALHLLPFSLLLWAGTGAALLSFEGCYMVYIQGSSPPEQVARTISNVFLFRGTARAVGSLVLGFVASFLAVGELSQVLAVGLLVVGGVGLLLSRSLAALAF